MKHTPGPWAWTPMSRDGAYQNSSLDAGATSVVFHSACWVPRKADRTLIAAAPELLDAAKQLLDLLNDDMDSEQCAAWDAMSAAIAKAEGRTK